MRVLIEVVGSHGDFLPFLAIGKELKLRGHEVQYYASAVFERYAQDAGLGFTSIGTVEEYQTFLASPDATHAVKGVKLLADTIMGWLPRTVEAMKKDVVPGETILVGSTFALGTRLVQEMLGVPTVTVQLAPSSFRSEYLAPRFYPLGHMEKVPRFIKRLLWKISDKQMLDPIFTVPFNQYRATLGLPPIARLMHGWIHEADSIVAMFPDWLAPVQPDWPAQLQLTNFPLHDGSSEQALSEEVLAFLDAGAPPIAFTTGTGNATSAEFFAASAEACRLAGRRGILLTSNPAQLPHPLPDGVAHFSFVPFKALLPRLAAFVHHGGVGSMSQAMEAGVPQLIRPMAFDQFDNASRAIKLGVAREVLPMAYKADKVAQVLNDLIDDGEVQAACQRIAARLAGANGAGETAELILKVVEQKRSGSLRSLDDLPHPPGLPVLGNLLDFKELARVHQKVEAWGREYGPLFTFRMGLLRVLAVSDHELIGTIMRDRPAGFRRPARLPVLAGELGFSSGVFISEGEAWAKQRRMIMASFAPNHVKNFFPALVRVAGRLRKRWAKAAQAGEGIDLQADLMRYTVDAVSGLSFGRDINTLESDEEVIQLHLDRVFSGIAKRSVALFPYWRVFKLPADRRMDASVAFIKTEISRFIANARAQMQADPALRESPKNLLQAMIVATEQNGSGLDDNDVMCNVFNLLLAGEDTTANTLAWLIHLLSRHPELLHRATEEVLRVAPDMASFSIEQMNELPFIEACLNETMRLKPIAPYMPLEAVKDTVIGDVRVPAGTFIWEIFRHDTTNEKYFPKAEQFNPERWLEGSDAALASNSAKRISMPFGAGARACPGRYLAMLEMKLAMAMVLGNFVIESAALADGGEAPEHMLFTMKPDGVILRLRERA